MLVYCATCSARVDASVKGEYSHHNEYAGDLYNYLLLRCPQCDSPMLVYQTDAGYSDGKIAWSDAKPLYPSEREVSSDIPLPIRRSFHEALVCRNAGAYLASVVMCRRTLEALASHHLGKVRN